LRGIEVAQAIAAGFKRVFPGACYEIVPVADGGDGTLDALVSALGGREVEATVTGPNGAPVRAHYGLMSERGLAVVEMAQASGLALLPPGTNNPMTATSRGTGELIVAALDAGAKRIIVAIGGSATNDAGTGALAALSARFLDASRHELPPGGAALARLNRVDAAELDARLHGVTIEIASDVTNPLCGPNGASAIYGPQKGASPDDVRELDGALAHFASVASELTGTDIRNVPGAGAAGGFGGGFLALAGAQLRPGADLVLDVLDFSRRLEGADLVITGEGRIDKQTLSGKAPYAVAQAAHALGIPVVALAGSIALSEDELESAGIDKAVAIAPATMPVDEAMGRARELIESAAFQLAGGLPR
jgi:glycerate kinase